MPGKVYYDLLQHEMHGNLDKTAIARIELLSLPYTEITTLSRRIRSQETRVGSRRAQKHGRPRVCAAPAHRTDAEQLEIDYVGHPYRASPSEGYPGAHAVEQERLIKEALTE